MITQKYVKNCQLQLQYNCLNYENVFSLDISYDINSSIAVVVLSQYNNFQLCNTIVQKLNLDNNYISGFLALKEFIPMKNIIEKYISNTVKKPTLIIIDGCGRFHPYNAGLACYINYYFQIPCIGVSKNYLHINKNYQIDQTQQKISNELFIQYFNEQANTPEQNEHLVKSEQIDIKKLFKDSIKQIHDDGYYMEYQNNISAVQIHLQKKNQSGLKREFISLGFTISSNSDENKILEMELLKQIAKNKDFILQSIRHADLTGRSVLGSSQYCKQEKIIFQLID